MDHPPELPNFHGLNAPQPAPSDRWMISHSSPKGTRSDLIFQVVQRHRMILRDLLFWLQDQTYYRVRWHRMATELPLFEPDAVSWLDSMLGEVLEVRQRFPYGYDPSCDLVAKQLQGRLGILKCELEDLRQLCVHYSSMYHRP